MMCPTIHKADELNQIDEQSNPCLYSIQRKVVLDNNLEILLPHAVELLACKIGDNILSVKFYNSIHHSLKIVLGVRVKPLDVYDWSTFRSHLKNILSSHMVVMFIPVAQSMRCETMSCRAAVLSNTFPPPVGIGASISAIGAERSGSLGAYFRLINPDNATETTVFLTASQTVVPNDNKETNTAIRSPCHKDIEALLLTENKCLTYVKEQLRSTQDKVDLGGSTEDQKWLVNRLSRIEEIAKKIQSLELASSHPRSVVIGNVLDTSTPGSTGTKGSKMHWTVVKDSQDKTTVKNKRPDMDRAWRLEPRSIRYDIKCDYWELGNLSYNQWICFHGATSGVRSGYTNGMRTFVNGTYEIEGLAADFPNMSDYYDEIPPTRILYSDKLNPLTEDGDSGASIWDEEGDLVGLLWGDDTSGAFMTSIDEMVEDVKRKTGMDLEPIQDE